MFRHNIAWLFLICTIPVMLVRSLQSQPTPTDPAFLEEFNRGQQALAGGKYDDALSAFKKANKLQKNTCARCYLGMAVAYLREGEGDRTLENCDKAISTATDDNTRSTAHNLKGNVLLVYGEKDPGKFSQAETEYRLASQLDSVNPIYHFGVAMSLLKQSKDVEAVEELNRCLALHPQPDVEQRAIRLIAAPRMGRVTMAPHFQFTTLQGKEISLEQLSGKIVVLDFWATWCPPCRESVPELKELTKKYSSERLAVISISADEDEKVWREYIAKKSMDWPQYLDADEKIRNAFGVKAFPTYLVLDGEGIIRQRIQGLNPQQSVIHRLREVLQTLPTLQAEKKE